MKRSLSPEKPKKLKRKKRKNNLKTKRFGIRTPQLLEPLSEESKSLISLQLMTLEMVKVKLVETRSESAPTHTIKTKEVLSKVLCISLAPESSSQKSLGNWTCKSLLTRRRKCSTQSLPTKMFKMRSLTSPQSKRQEWVPLRSLKKSWMMITVLY